MEEKQGADELVLSEFKSVHSASSTLELEHNAQRAC